jgi:spermidine/putrescine transport system substrate-binding protein
VSKRDLVLQTAVRFLFVVIATGLLSAGLFWGGSMQDDSQAVTIYAYCDMLAQEDFEAFTEKTGIKVVVRHFESIEEIMTKLTFTHESNIDLVAPTDAMVEVLIQKKCIAPLDRSLLSEFENLDPRLMKLFYDPTNTYSVPFSWTPVGIGYDTRALSLPREHMTWGMLFDGPYLGNICLGEDPIETISLAMIHLYGEVLTSLTPAQEAEIVAVLTKQKEWVECYTNNLRYFLVSGVSPAVVLPAAYMIQQKQHSPWAEFVIPDSGTVMFVGNMALVGGSKKHKQAHAVINYLLSEEGAMTCFNNHAFLPTNVKACQKLPAYVVSHRYLFPEGDVFRSIKMLNNSIPLKTMEKIWQQAIV